MEKKGSWSVLPKVDFSLSFDGTEDDDQLFLNSLSIDEMKRLLKKFGIIDRIEHLGFVDYQITFDLRDSFVHKAHLTAKKEGTEYQLIELFMRRVFSPQHFKTKMDEETVSQKGHQLFFESLSKFAEEDPALHILAVEWMRMENPTEKFHRDPLPGQNHPGLGQGRTVDKLIQYVAETKKRDGVANTPAYFHNAYFYSIIGYKFGDPEIEGMFHTLIHDLKSDIDHKGISAVSHSFLQGRVKLLKTNQIVIWDGCEQLHACSKRLVHYLESRDYRKLCESKQTKGLFKIDWDGPLPSESDIKQHSIRFSQTLRFYNKK